MTFISKSGDLRKDLIFFSLCGVLIVLPLDHTITVRYFLILLPAFLWGAGMVARREFDVRSTTFELPLLLYLAAVVFSLFTSMKLSVSVDELRKEFLTCTLLFYMVASVSDMDDVVKYLKLLVAASFAMAVYGIVEFFAMGGSVLSFAVRADALHQGYEAYAQYIIMVLPFALAGLLWPEARRWRWFFAVAIVFNLIVLYLTHTRGAWVALWVELVLANFFFIKKNRYRYVIVAALIFLPPLAIKLLPRGIVMHEFRVRGAEIDTGSMRLEAWKVALKGISEDPFEAAGYGRTNFKRRFPGLDLDQAHNSFINTATSLGVQGLAALLIIIAGAVRMNWRIYRRSSGNFQKNFAAASIVMTVGFFTANQFAEFYVDDAALLFWFLTAMSVVVYRASSDAAARDAHGCG